MRDAKDIERTVELFGDMVYRLSIVNLQNKADAEDNFQSVFLKYAQSKEIFHDDEHLKAWLIKVTLNKAKDMWRNWFRRNSVSLDEIAEVGYVDDSHREVFDAVMALPKKYREVIYLHYYEGYKAMEIAELLKLKVNTVYTLMDRAKKELKEALKENE